MAAMGFAFLLNLTAFPLCNGLQPYVAKEIYGTDQTGLGYMVAGAAFGALVGSILLTPLRPRRAPGAHDDRLLRRLVRGASRLLAHDRIPPRACRSSSWRASRRAWA